MRYTKTFLKTVAEFKHIPKNVYIKYPNDVVDTGLSLPFYLASIIDVSYRRIFFTRKSLKHLVEKKLLGEELVEAIPLIINKPDEVRVDFKYNRFILSKSIELERKPKVVIIELQYVSKFIIIITSFTANKKYLSNFDLLWRTETSS